MVEEKRETKRAKVVMRLRQLLPKVAATKKRLLKVETTKTTTQTRKEERRAGTDAAERMEPRRPRKEIIMILLKEMLLPRRKNQSQKQKKPKNHGIMTSKRVYRNHLKRKKLRSMLVVHSLRLVMPELSWVQVDMLL